MIKKAILWGVVFFLGMHMSACQQTGFWVLSKLSEPVDIISGNENRTVGPRHRCFIPALVAGNSQIQYSFSARPGGLNLQDLALDDQLKLFQRRDIRCSQYILQEQSHVEIQALSKEFYILFNATGKKIYCAWYHKPSSGGTCHVLTTPRSFEINRYKEIFPPQNIDASQKIGFVVSLRPLKKGDTLDVNNDLKNSDDNDAQENDSDFLCIDKERMLWKFGEQHVVVLNDDKKLQLCDKHQIKFTLINTTNDPLVCAVYEHSNTGGVLGRRCTPIQKIEPQFRALFSLPSQESLTPGHCYRLVIGPKGSLSDSGTLTGDINTFLNRDLHPPLRDDMLFVLRTVHPGGNWKLESVEEWPHRLVPTVLWNLVPSQGHFSAVKLAQAERKILKGHKVSHEQTDDIPVLLSRNLTNLRNDDEEKQFISKRLKIVEPAIEEFLDSYEVADTDDETEIVTPVPKIAMVFTGGGYRAMIGSTGFLEGAEESGLLDCCLYMGGLSGSTWALTGYVNSLPVEDNVEVDDNSDSEDDEPTLSVSQFAEALCKRVNYPTVHSDFASRIAGVETLVQLFYNVAHESDYVKRSFVQERFRQYQGWAGFYGHALAHSLLSTDTGADRSNDAHHLKLSDLRKNLESARCPLPLCVAIDSEYDTDENHRWVEFSPYYTGFYKKQISQQDPANSMHKGWHIETKRFGSRMSDGELIHKCPEYPLAYLMGVWGLAFAVSPTDARNEGMGPLLTVPHLMDKLINLYDMAFAGRRTKKVSHEERTTVGAVPNFAYKQTSATNSLDLFRNRERLDLIDGGLLRVEGTYTHNFASIPMLARKADVLIMCDTTPKPNQDVPTHLVAAQKEAHDLGLPFPEITQDIIDQVNNNRATLIDTGKGPIIVYMKIKQDDSITRGFKPDKKNSKHLKTENFKYTPDQFNEYKDHAKGIILQDDVIEKMQAAIYRAQRQETRYGAEEVLLDDHLEVPTNFTSSSPSNDQDRDEVTVQLSTPNCDDISDGLDATSCLETIEGKTIHDAAKQGDLELLKRFEFVGDVADCNEYTPLHYAAFHGHIDCCKYLVDRGARSDYVGKDGFTPLLHAQRKGHANIVELFSEISHGSGGISDELDTISLLEIIDGKTIHDAAKQGDLELLKRFGIACDVPDSNEYTPLHYAACYGHLECCIYLMNQGVRRDYINNEGDTPVQLAQQKGHAEIIELFSGISHSSDDATD